MMRRIVIATALTIALAVPAVADYNGPGSLSNSDGTLTLTPNPIASVGTISVNQANPFVWTGFTTFGNLTVINGTTGILENPVILAPSGGTGSTGNAYGILAGPLLSPGTLSGNSCNTGTGSGCSFAFGQSASVTLTGAGTTTLSLVGYNCNLNISNSFSGTVNNSLCYEAGDLALGTGAGGGTLPIDFYQFYGVTSTAYNGLTSGSYTVRGLSLGGSSAAAGAGETLLVQDVHLDFPTGSSSGNTLEAIDITGNCPATTAVCWGFHEASTAPNLFSGQVQVSSGSDTIPSISDTSGTNGIYFGASAINMAIGNSGAKNITFLNGGETIFNTAPGSSVLTLEDVNSASPTATTVGQINFSGFNSTPAVRAYGQINGTSTIVTAGGETSSLSFLTYGGQGTAGTQATMLTLSGAASPSATFGTNVKLVSSAAVTLSGLPSSSAGTTGTVCWTTGGTINVDTTTTCLLSLLKLKDLHGPITGDEALHDIMSVNPYWITWKKDAPEYAGDKQVQPSLIADQVAKIDKRLVAYDPKGNLHGVRYQELTAVLIAGMQKQQSEIAALTSKVAELESRHAR